MILYLDAGSLLRHYVLDSGSADVDAWMAHADLVATSCSSLIEVAAGLSRRPPWTRPSRAWLSRALQRLESDWSDYLVIEPDERRAAAFAWRRRMCAPDAIHLAAAATIAELAAPIPLVFSSFDRELCRVAREEGLAVIQPPQ